MLFLQSQQLAYLAIVYSLFLSINLVNALPLRIRQNGATTVQTVHTTQTIAGPLTETCVITLTPITDKNGQPAVEEVKKCSLAYDNPDGGGGGAGSSASSSVTTFTTANTAGNTTPPTVTGTSTGTSTTAESSPPATITSTGDNQTSSTSVSGSSTATGTTTATGTSTNSGASSSVATTSLASSSAPPVSGIHANGVSTVTGIPTPTGTTSTTAGLPTITTSPTSTPVTAAPDANASASGASAAAAEQPSESTDAFQLPGKKLSVLPIGLGVFAGISVIALIVVGLVTYERTKYRKAFRQRKLAESGATMGYGGMAQRS